jgi:ribulose bisphosphate carboxylase small subunit
MATPITKKKYITQVRYGLVEEYVERVEYATEDDRQMDYDHWDEDVSKVTIDAKFMGAGHGKIIIPWNSVTSMVMTEEVQR